MRILLNQNKSFLFVYFLFALAVLSILAYFGKHDAQLFANQYYSPFFDSLFFYSTKIVEWFSVAVFLFLLLFKGIKKSLNGLIIYGITALVTFTLKRQVFAEAMRPTFDNTDFRLLPSEFAMGQLSNNSFPSGHTTAAFTLFCYLTLISKNKNLGYLFGFIAVLVGYSRVYLSQHYFEDILAGATIGTLLTFITFYFLNKINFSPRLTKPLFKYR